MLARPVCLHIYAIYKGTMSLILLQAISNSPFPLSLGTAQHSWRGREDCPHHAGAVTLRRGRLVQVCMTYMTARTLNSGPVSFSLQDAKSQCNRNTRWPLGPCTRGPWVSPESLSCNYPSTHPSFHPSINHLSLHPSIHLSIHLSISPSIRLYSSLSHPLSLHSPIYLSIFPSVRLFFHLYIHPSIYLANVY